MTTTLKNNLLLQKGLYVAAISAVIIFSFFSFSEAYYPLLNSDSALNVLMTRTIHFPEDLYCWGQDRGGTLIPLLGHLLMKATGMTALWACSLSHYFILVVGFIFFARMFTLKFTRLVLAVVWFFPPSYMVSFVLYPFSTQFSIMAVMIFLTHRIFIGEGHMKKSLQILYVIIICFLCFLAIWVSDLSCLSIFVLLGFIFYRYYLRQEGTFINRVKTITGSFEFSIATLLSIAGVIFIFYAKSQATKTLEYNEHIINSFPDVIHSVWLTLSPVVDMLCFRSKDLLMGVYVYALIIAAGVLIYFYRKTKYRKNDTESNVWPWFFLANAILSLFLLLFSHWVFLNGVSCRYFVVVYISLWLAFLFYADSRSLFKNKIISAAIIIIGFSSVVSGVFSFYYPNRLKPAVDIAAEFKALGEIGIIGEYWNSYIYCTPDPDNIKATPHDKDTYRSEKMIEEVFDQPAIYVIKDMWMKTFPDTLEQFGYLLKKKGPEFYLGGSYTCEYEKVKIHRIFYLADMKTNKGKIATDSVSKLQVLAADTADRDQYSSLVFGPAVHLGKGKYKVLFHIKIDRKGPDDTLAVLDACDDWGKNILMKKYLHTGDFKDAGSFEEIELDFATPKRLTSAEFRINYLGKRKLWFDHVELKQQ